MFTGIIESCARVISHELSTEFSRLRLETGYHDLRAGESLAVNGACLTVSEADTSGNALFFLSLETLSRTGLGLVTSGSRANLERAATLNTLLSGHLVQGHVDGLARLVSSRERSQAHELEFSLPQRFGRYCVEKGSIALNGVSLTINAVASGNDETRVSVTIIPHTWENTNLSDLRPGDAVNVEVDLIAKYLEKLWQPSNPQSSP